jgi:fumarate reductase subunit D
MIDPKRSASRRSEWWWWGLAVVICASVIVFWHFLVGTPDAIPAGLSALALCALISAGPIFWRRGAFGNNMPVASTLLAITLRMLPMIGALGLVAATKWSYRNSFAGSLLGCYFIFLALESALSIRHFSSRTPS